MPGNAGMSPDHSRRSVPVLTPLQATSTTTVLGPGRRQLEPIEDQMLGLLQDNGEGFQGCSPCPVDQGLWLIFRSTVSLYRHSGMSS